MSPYRTLAQLDDRSYLIGDSPAPGYFPTTLGNPDLKWETTTSANVGLDLGMWNDRVHVTLDAFEEAAHRLGAEVDPRTRTLSVAAPNGPADLRAILDALDDLDVEEASLAQPTLDDAFFALA